MGLFYDLIQEHIDAQPYPVADRKVAMALGVSPSMLKNWREPKQLIAREHVEAVAKLTGVPYQEVVEALLYDIGYALDVPQPRPARRTERRAR